MMADFIGDLIAYLFAQNQKAHPMPLSAQTGLFEKIKLALERKEVT